MRHTSQLANVLASVACLEATKRAGLGVQATWLVFIALVFSRVVQASVRVFVTQKPWTEHPGAVKTPVSINT